MTNKYYIVERKPIGMQFHPVYDGMKEEYTLREANRLVKALWDFYPESTEEIRLIEVTRSVFRVQKRERAT